MMGPIHGGATPGGMNDVTARIAAIQSRIESLTGPQNGAVPVIDAPVADRELAEFEPLLQAMGANAAPTVTTVAAATPAAATNPTATAPVTPASAAGAVDPALLDPSSAGAALAAKLPPHGRQWASAIAEAALREGVEPTLLAALVQHESNFKPTARSHAGAIGLAQLMPGTAAGLNVDPHDPAQNLAGGARYLRTQLDKFGSVDLALAAYNAGPNRVAQAGGVPRIPETMAYVTKVTATWEQMRR